MEKRLNPLVDFAFKRIFGVEENKDLLLDFLNAILKYKNPIESIELLNPYIDKSALDDKLSILDIKAKLTNGELVDIEVQIANSYDIEKRSLYYWSKMYSGQSGEGEIYKKLKKTITINILDFIVFEFDKFHSIFSLIENETKLKFSDDLEIHFLEMPKFEKVKLVLSDKLNEWLLFLRDPNNKTLEEIMENEEKIKKAVTVLDYISQDRQERMLYEARQKAIMDYNSNMFGAREEGEKKGRMETAKMMILDGMEITLVSKYTGINIEELKKINI